MFTFSQYLEEYLTDTQRQKYARIQMTDKARADTDHYFGAGNDHVREDLNTDKSETHKRVEQHLGRTLSPEEYRSGKITSKSGLPKNIGGFIKDPSLRQEYSKDSTRLGDVGNYVTVVRDKEVAGQTNPEPNAEHPTGHAWKDESCKNNETGCNRNYLGNEIRHGTVVVRGHNQHGQEIYRATLQPHHDEEGNHAIYTINSEYGLKHPEFVAKAHEVASKLSGPYRPGFFKIHEDVYNDSGSNFAFHPKATEADLDREMKEDSTQFLSKLAAVQHPNLSERHIRALAKDDSEDIRELAIRHRNVTGDIVEDALKNSKYRNVKQAAVTNRKATAKHIGIAQQDEDPEVRKYAIKNTKATSDQLFNAIRDTDYRVRREVAKHPKLKPEHINEILDLDPKGEHNNKIKMRVMTHKNLSEGNINKVLNLSDEAPNIDLKTAALEHDNVTENNIDNAQQPHQHQFVREAAIRNRNAQSRHVGIAMQDPDPYVRIHALRHDNATDGHIKLGLQDPNPYVRSEAEKAMKKRRPALEKTMDSFENYLSSIRQKQREAGTL